MYAQPATRNCELLSAGCTVKGSFTSPVGEPDILSIWMVAGGSVQVGVLPPVVGTKVLEFTVTFIGATT